MNSIDFGAKSKAHQAFTEDAQYGWEGGGGQNTYVRIWGLKRGEGVCSKGAYFQELTVWLTTHKFVCIFLI